MNCPKCQHPHYVKNGVVNSVQRYQCKDCHYQWTRTTPQGCPPEQKTLAVLLYCHGISMNAISKLFQVSATAVLKWIRTSVQKLASKPTLSPGTRVVLDLDEMWHYIGKKKINFGYGKHSTETQDTPPSVQGAAASTAEKTALIFS